VASLTDRRTAGIVIGAVIALTIGISTTAFAQIIVPPYPYGYRYAAPDASVRFDVKPKDAAVYIDGYYAGLVDDYDGAFQRLRTAAGGHEITLFLEGYRTYSEQVYLSADNTFKLRHRMERLAAGQVAERPPAPKPPPQYQPGQPGQGQPFPGEAGQPPQPRGPFGRRGPRPSGFPPSGPDNAPPPPPGAPGGPGGQVDASNGRGTLSLSLEPADADVLVDGTPWQSDGQARLTIDLAEGRHSLQIRKAGYIGYLTDVQIRPGETTNIDVQLKTQPR